MLTEREAYNYDVLEIVPERWSCPSCGERRFDYLEWQDDDIVRCTTCGVEYDPAQQARS